MPMNIIASGTVLVNVTQDVGTHVVNKNNNPDVDAMTASSLVFLSPLAGTPDGAKSTAFCAPSGYGPLFIAAVTSKGKGFFNLVVEAAQSNGWNVQNLPVDYVVLD